VEGVTDNVDNCSYREQTGSKRTYLIQFCDYVTWVFVYQNSTDRSDPTYNQILLTMRVSEQIQSDGFVR